jgi:hypothetical protein
MREIAPFARLTASDESAVFDMASESDVVVVVASPFGPENLGNLRAVSRAAVPVVLVGQMSERLDFSRGEALALWRRLEAAGARSCTDARGVVRCIGEVRL